MQGSMTREDFVKERRDSAMEIFRRGYNCCQAVLLAFEDITGLDSDSLVKIGSGLGGGVARMRDVCGTVSGMAIVCGFICPSDDPQDQSKRKACYSLVQRLAGEFRDLNGSVVCRELLGLEGVGWQKPEPSARGAQFYKKRPCEQLVGDSAAIIAAYLYDKNSAR